MAKNEPTKRTRRGGQNRRIKKAEENREKARQSPMYVSYLIQRYSDQLEESISTGCSNQ